MYEPQEPPAVYSSVLASSVIIMAAGSCLLPPCVVPAFGLRLHIPELLSDALLFRRGLLGLLPSVDLPLPCGQIAVVLLHKGCSGVIRPFERLHIGILYELSWLWETLVIALAVAAVCVVCAMLICKAVKKNLSKKTAAVIGAAAFAGAVLAVIVIARTPMPL